MAAQKGKDLLLKVDSDGLGTFTTVAGLRSRSLAFNAETVDITHQESAGQWRELLQGAGIKAARITGSGIFKDAASDATVRDYFFNGTIQTWQIIIPDFGTVAGAFQITSLEFSGRHDNELGFEVSLDSAGALSFVAIYPELFTSTPPSRSQIAQQARRVVHFDVVHRKNRATPHVERSDPPFRVEKAGPSAASRGFTVAKAMLFTTLLAD